MRVLELPARLQELVAGEFAEALGAAKEDRRRVSLGKEEGLGTAVTRASATERQRRGREPYEEEEAEAGHPDELED